MLSAYARGLRYTVLTSRMVLQTVVMYVGPTDTDRLEVLQILLYCAGDYALRRQILMYCIPCSL